MTIKGFIISILLGVIGFTVTIAVISVNAKDDSTHNSRLVIVNNTEDLRKDSLIFDTISLISNKLNLAKHSMLNTLTIDEIKKGKVFTYKQINFSIHPYFMVWVVLISISVGLSLAIIPYLIMLIREYEMKSPVYIHLKIGVLSVLSISLIFNVTSLATRNMIINVVDIISTTNILFDNSETIITVIIAILFVPNIFCLHGSFIIVSTLFKNLSKTNLDQIREFQNKYSQFLYISSVALVLGVITTSLIRYSILDVLPENLQFLMPKQSVASYGITLTFFLILFYLPGELLISKLLQDAKAKKAADDSTSVKDNKEQSVFKIGLTMISPALIGFLLDGFKFL